MELLTQWFAPAAAAALGAGVALGFDAWNRRAAAAGSAAAGSLLAGALAAASAIRALQAGSSMEAAVLAWLTALVAVLGATALLGGWRTFADSEHGGRMSALAGLAVASALLAMTTSDLVVLVIALESMSLTAYGLVALGATDRAREAAMKYFVQGAVASGLLLVALAVLFVGARGTGAYTHLFAIDGGLGPGQPAGAFPSGALLLAWTLLAVALAFKAGAFPFHSWAPDAYETAPAAAAGLLASVSKVAAVAVMAVLLGSRVLQAPLAGANHAAIAIAMLAAGSITFGNLVALRQRSLRRMLAYSGIAQVGYALIGIVTGAPWTTLLLVAVYAPAALGAFLVAEALENGGGGWDGTIQGLSGLSRRRPALAAALVVFMLSLTGVPLFAGFVGKLVVFASAARGPWLWLAVLGAVGSVVSFGYYGAVIRAAYMGTDGDAPAPERHGVADAKVAACALAVVVVVAGVAPLLSGVTAALRFLFAG